MVEVCGRSCIIVCCKTICFNQIITLSPLVSLMQKFWSFSFFSPWGDRQALLSFEHSNQLLSFMVFQVFWASWEFEFSKVCEIWMKYNLPSAFSPSWYLSLDFLALHISHVLLLLGFTILKLHASSRLCCWFFDLLALHYFHALLLLLFIACRHVGKSNTPPPTRSSSSSSWFFIALKEIWPPLSCVL